MLKRSVVIKAGRLKPIKIDYKTVVLFTLFICGVIIGVSVVKSGGDEWNLFSKKILTNYLSAKSNGNILKCFSSTFVMMISVAFISFLTGLCAVGVPFIGFVPLLFGGFCGVAVSTFVVNFGIQGLVYCTIINIPCYAITAASIIKCSCESLKMSLELFGAISDSGFGDCKRKGYLKEYTVNYLVLCIPIAIGSLASAIGFEVFSGLFNFV